RWCRSGCAAAASSRRGGIVPLSSRPRTRFSTAMRLSPSTRGAAMHDAITYQRLTETVHAFQGEIALFAAGMFLGAAITCAVCVRVWVRWQDEHHYRMVRIAATRVPVAGEVVPGHHCATYWQRAVNEL